MKLERREKIAEIIKEAAANFIQMESTSASLITVTRAELTEAGKDAIVFFTTLPTSEEDTALKFLERKTPEFKHFLKEHSRIGIIPFLHFKIDYGERNRQRLDELTAEGL
jgi:ribosome-binding factor A